MPTLISIAVETPKLYVALDSQSNAWQGQVVTERDGSLVITWVRVSSKFRARREPVSPKMGDAPTPPEQED